MEEKQKGRTLGGLQKEIEDLKQRIALMDADNSALAADLEHWKKVAAGLKGQNKRLSERLKHYKELDLEGDNLYEDKIKELEEKNKVIEGLQCQVNKIAEKNKTLETELAANNDLICEMNATINKQKPWWKKFF